MVGKYLVHIYSAYAIELNKRERERDQSVGNVSMAGIGTAAAAEIQGPLGTVVHKRPSAAKSAIPLPPTTITIHVFLCTPAGTNMHTVWVCNIGGNKLRRLKTRLPLRRMNKKREALGSFRRYQIGIPTLQIRQPEKPEGLGRS